jgi:spore germination protein YaaH
MNPQKRASSNAGGNFVVNAFFEGNNDISNTETQYNNLVKYKDKIDYVSFYGASLGGDGSVETNYDTDESTSKALNFCKQNNIKSLLALQNYKNNTYNADVVKNALELNMNKSVDSVMQVVDKFNMDGVNIVFEFTYDNLRDKQTEFATLLANRLKAENKTLVVTVGAYFNDESEGESLYDYSGLSNVADYINIILYDDNSSNAYNSGKIDKPGCTSNLVRIDRVIKYAKMKIPSNKILLALGSYGVDFDLTNRTAKNISFAEVYEHALQSTDGWVCNSEEGSGYFAYGNNHIVYCETDAGINERIIYAKDNGLGGMTYFSLSSDFSPFFKHID